MLRFRANKISVFGPTVPIAIESVWDGGYRYGFNGMERDNKRDAGSREISHSQDASESGVSNYSVLGNSPIFYIDPNGDDIDLPGGTKKQRRRAIRLLRQRPDWRFIRNTYTSGFFRNGRIYSKAQRDLSLKASSIVANDIINAPITPTSIVGAGFGRRDLRRNVDNLDYNPTETRVFTIDNRFMGGANFSLNATESLRYTIRRRDFNSLPVGLLPAINLNDFLRPARSYNVNLNLINLQPDDLNPANPAVYTFNFKHLDRDLVYSANGILNFPNINFDKFGRIRVDGLWNVDAFNQWDQCNGFLISLTVSRKRI